MSLNTTSLADGIGVSVNNTRFKAGASVVPRKILIIGTFDPLKTSAVPNVPMQIFSPEHCGANFGFGFMLHRLAVQAFLGSAGVETWVIPQSEAGGSVKAAGKISITGPATAAGTLYIYIAGIVVPVSVASGDAATAVAGNIITAINAMKELPVTAVVGTNAYDVTVTSKSSGPWGNAISILMNLGLNQAVPAGLSVTITSMANGAGVPTIATALNALGTGDGANDAFFTDMVHGYGQDTTTLDAVLLYVGSGNTATGLWDSLVGRPFRSLVGDTAAGSAGLTALTTLSGNRKSDRATGVIAVPGAPNHPAEIAALTIGVIAAVNNDLAEGSYLGLTLPGIIPGAVADRWTSTYDNRDAAVKAGISPTRVRSGVVQLQNVISFYRPDDVPVTSNGYRSMRNISILQNILANIRSNFDREKWQGVSIVKDTIAVTDIASRKKSRDIDSVIDDLTALAKSFESMAWIFSADYTVKALAEPGAVSIRTGGTGFNSQLSLVLSGEGGIFNNVVNFDTDISVAM
jgi:phage tail sheath gpL-like